MTKFLFLLAALQLCFAAGFAFTDDPFSLDKPVHFNQASLYHSPVIQASIGSVQELLEMPASQFWITVAAILLVVFLRIVPTSRNYDIIHLLVKIVDFLIPNRATGPPEEKSKFSISKIFKTSKSN